MVDPSPKRLSTPRVLALSTLAFPLAGIGLPLGVYLSPFYADELGLGLALTGTLFMMLRLLDMVLDPTIGHFVDRFTSKWGRARPWIVASVPMLMLSAFFVYLPLAKIAKFLNSISLNTSNIPLHQYADLNFYMMKNDALDRFGTKLEKRYNKQEISKLLLDSGFDPTSQFSLNLNLFGLLQHANSPFKLQFRNEKENSFFICFTCHKLGSFSTS